MEKQESFQFSIPQMRDFVPSRLRPWIMILFVLVFQFSGGVYLASLADMVGSTQLLREDVQMAGTASMIGMALYFCIMFRMKMAVKSKPTFVISGGTIIVCNLICAHTVCVPLLVFCCFIAGFCRIWGTFECNSTIQLWLTPKRDMSIFFTYIYLIVNSAINLSGIMSVYVAFWSTWAYMHYLIVAAMAVMLLLVYIMYNDKRVMPPLPLYGIDWLGMLMWGVIAMCVAFVCIYGEHYDWWHSWQIRFATVLGIVTFIVNRRRSMFIRHSFIFHDLFTRFPIVLKLIVLIIIADTLLAPQRIIEHAYMEAILGYDSLNTISLNWIGFAGSVIGCATMWVIFGRWKWSYHRMAVIAFVCFTVYLAYFYFSIDYNLSKEALYFPVFIRSFGYVVLGIAVLTANTRLPFPFYFTQAVCMQNMFSAALANAIGSAIVGRMLTVFRLRNFMEISESMDSVSAFTSPDNIASLYGAVQIHALLESMKEVYGVLLVISVLMVLMLAIRKSNLRPTKEIHPLFTTIRSALSFDMLKKMRAERFGSR